jgi:spore germination protein YaaH
VNASNGSISNPSNWPWTDLINYAHNEGIKMIMVAVNFSGSDIHKLITDQTVKNIFFQNVKGKIETYNLDGINIDFEGVQSADRGAAINNFMAELTDYVHTNIGADKEVSFASPAVNWGGWEFVGLANSCDYLFIMGYDFNGSWSSNAGPSAPIVGGNYNITRTLNDASTGYANVINTTPEKLILGVPYYGNNWRTSSMNQGATALQYIGSKRYRTAMQELGSRDLLWSYTYQTPWYTYESGGNYYQTWFDNEESLALKFDLAKSKNLKGVGMWALNYDQYRTELWDLLRTSFLDTAEESELPDGFKLYQNYPNPFNPITTIEYELVEDSKIEINIYNIMGEKIIQLFNSHQVKGRHSIDFNANGLESGAYLYEIKSSSHSKIKKMLLIK